MKKEQKKPTKRVTRYGPKSSAVPWKVKLERPRPKIWLIHIKLITRDHEAGQELRDMRQITSRIDRLLKTEQAKGFIFRGIELQEAVELD